MGYAVFPLRTRNGGRVMVNTAQVVALKEDQPADGTGQASIQLAGGQIWFLSEDATTVYTRLAAAATASSPVFPP